MDVSGAGNHGVSMLPNSGIWKSQLLFMTETSYACRNLIRTCLLPLFFIIIRFCVYGNSRIRNSRSIHIQIKLDVKHFSNVRKLES